MKDNIKTALAWLGSISLLIFGVVQTIFAATETQSITGSYLLFEQAIIGCCGILTIMLALVCLAMGIWTEISIRSLVDGEMKK